MEEGFDSAIFEMPVQKRLTKRSQGLIAIGAAVICYFADCMIAHPKHPDVSWLKSGVYSWGPFGIVLTVLIAVTGFCYMAGDN